MPFLDLSFPGTVRCLSGGSCPSSATPGPAEPVPTWLTFIILSFCSLCRRRPGRARRRNPGERETQSYSRAPVPGVRRAPARTGPTLTGAPDPPHPRPSGPATWGSTLVADMLHEQPGAARGRGARRLGPPREAGPVTRALAAPGPPPPPRAPAGRRRRRLLGARAARGARRRATRLDGTH